MPTVVSRNTMVQARYAGGRKDDRTRSRCCNILVRADTGPGLTHGYEVQIHPKRGRIVFRWGGWFPDSQVGRAMAVRVTIDRGAVAANYGGFRVVEVRGGGAVSAMEFWQTERFPIRRRHRLVVGFDWSPLLAIGRSICAGRDPLVILDWFMDNLPEPWRHLGEEPFARFFASVCPIPLAEEPR